MRLFQEDLSKKVEKGRKINILSAFHRHLKPITKITLFSLLTAILIIPGSEAGAAGSLTTVKDTLLNDRPSTASTISSNITAGDTTINISSTAGVNQGDTITICNATCSTTETKVVSGVLNGTQLSLTIGATNTYATGNVYDKITSKHTITFTTRTPVSNGKFVISIPATNTTTPTSASFGLNNITVATSTEYTLTGFSATTLATSTSASNVLFTFNFTGSVASNTAISIAMGNTNPLLNPTKSASQGTADTYSVVVTEQDSGGSPIDTTTANVGTIEAVGVSASVTPSLNFTINGVTSGASVTAHNTVITSTATSVPFGSLTVNASSTIAQYVHVDTNSNSGYAVTVQQDGSLRKSNGTTIVDFSTTAAENDGSVGFGYALHSKLGAPTLPFNYNDAGAKFKAAGFSSSTPVTIMSNSAPTSGDEVYVDYYTKVNSSQAQGNYQNLITYIATAIY
jgi:hypothetical protein